MKTKITESQLRRLIAESITKSLNEGLFGPSKKEKERQRQLLIQKENERWKQEEININKKIKADVDKILPQLNGEIYVTIFFNNNKIIYVAIQNKEDAAYRVAETKHGCSSMGKAQLKGPFESYNEANTWIRDNGLGYAHRVSWDSENITNEFQSVDGLMVGDDISNFIIKPEDYSKI